MKNVFQDEHRVFGDSCIFSSALGPAVRLVAVDDGPHQQGPASPRGATAATSYRRRHIVVDGQLDDVDVDVRGARERGAGRERRKTTFQVSVER